MKIDKWVLTGLSALLITAFLWTARWYRHSESKEIDDKAKAQSELLVRPYSPVLGRADAPVTVVEFLDPECEACRSLYPIVKDVLKRFEGKARLVVRYMPLHKNSSYAASVLEGARKQEKYWEALEMLFAKQPEWGSHHAPRPDLIPGYMKQLGLDMERLNASLGDLEIESKIRQDEDDGRKLGVARTPAFFVNGKMLQELGHEQLSFAIQTSLNDLEKKN